MIEIAKAWLLDHIVHLGCFGLLGYSLIKILMDPREFLAYLLRNAAQEIKVLADNGTIMFDLAMTLLPKTWNLTLSGLTKAHTRLEKAAR